MNSYKTAARYISIILSVIIFISILILAIAGHIFLLLIYWLSILPIWLVYCLVFGHAHIIAESIEKQQISMSSQRPIMNKGDMYDLVEKLKELDKTKGTKK